MLALRALLRCVLLLCVFLAIGCQVKPPTGCPYCQHYPDLRHPADVHRHSDLQLLDATTSTLFLRCDRELLLVPIDADDRKLLMDMLTGRHGSTGSLGAKGATEALGAGQ